MFEFPGSNRHMKQNIRSFLFGTSLPNDRIFNLAWLLFRLHIGISIAFSAGLPKMTGFSAPDWFVKQVAEIGFTFPSPALWATLAAWGAFFGGILIAIGLFTRFAALQLAFQFFVISYIWYNEPAPITGMYFQQLYFFCYLLTMVAGGGRFSIDALISRKWHYRLPGVSPKIALVSLCLILGSQTLSAQDAAILKEDIAMIQGKWQGSLTYRDFKSGKDVTMPCNLNLEVKKNGKDLVMNYQYPDNAGWNSSDNITISADGRSINGDKITSRKKLDDGNVEIIIESKGQDGSTPATIRQIITFGPTTFTLTRQVQYMTTGEKFQRNQYKWVK
jgi:uncharacterized membrane protein YphA (DoxX/SURF4 family)